MVVTTPFLTFLDAFLFLETGVGAELFITFDWLPWPSKGLIRHHKFL